MNETWEEVWLDLCGALLRQPLRVNGPGCPCVLTLGQEVANDIIQVEEKGVIVRSARSGDDNFIEAHKFRVWWNHLQKSGTASLIPGGENNPHPWRSRLIGAIWVRCLPERIQWHPNQPNVLSLIGHAANVNQVKIEDLAQSG